MDADRKQEGRTGDTRERSHVLSGHRTSTSQGRMRSHRAHGAALGTQQRTLSANPDAAGHRFGNAAAIRYLGGVLGGTRGTQGKDQESRTSQVKQSRVRASTTPTPSYYNIAATTPGNPLR